MLPEKNKWYRILRYEKILIVHVTSSVYDNDGDDCVCTTTYYPSGSIYSDYTLFADKYDWVELTAEERVAFILEN